MHDQHCPLGPQTTSIGLVRGLRGADPGAWQQLVDLYSPLVYAWCRQSGVRPEDARDIGQEVFHRVAKGISKFQYERPSDTFRGWLWTITRSRIIDHFRKRQHEAHAAGGAAAQLQLAQLPDLQSLECEIPPPTKLSSLVWRALEVVRDEIEPRSWDAFWRVVVDDQSVAETAALLGMTPNAVRVAKCKTLRQLRETLGDVD